MSQPVSLGVQLWSDIDTVDLCLVLDTPQPQVVPTVVWLHRLVFQVNSTYASRISTAGTVAFHWTVSSIPSALAVIRFMYLKEWTWPTVLKQQQELFEDACRLGCFTLVRLLQPLVPVLWCTNMLLKASQQDQELKPASLPSLSKFYHERGRALSSATAAATTAATTAATVAVTAAAAVVIDTSSTRVPVASVSDQSVSPLSPRPRQKKQRFKRKPSPLSPLIPSRYCSTRFWSKHTRRRTYGMAVSQRP
jgi:hypothetical protein